jgi:hypothetical protein
LTGKIKVEIDNKNTKAKEKNNEENEAVREKEIFLVKGHTVSRKSFEIRNKPLQRIKNLKINWRLLFVSIFNLNIKVKLIQP